MVPTILTIALFMPRSALRSRTDGELKSFMSVWSPISAYTGRGGRRLLDIVTNRPLGLPLAAVLVDRTLNSARRRSGHPPGGRKKLNGLLFFKINCTPL